MRPMRPGHGTTVNHVQTRWMTRRARFLVVWSLLGLTAAAPVAAKEPTNTPPHPILAQRPGLHPAPGVPP